MKLLNSHFICCFCKVCQVFASSCAIWFKHKVSLPGVIGNITDCQRCTKYVTCKLAFYHSKCGNPFFFNFLDVSTPWHWEQSLVNIQYKSWISSISAKVSSGNWSSMLLPYISWILLWPIDWQQVILWSFNISLHCKDQVQSMRIFLLT